MCEVTLVGGNKISLKEDLLCRVKWLAELAEMSVEDYISEMIVKSSNPNDYLSEDKIKLAIYTFCFTDIKRSFETYKNINANP